MPQYPIAITLLDSEWKILAHELEVRSDDLWLAAHEARDTGGTAFVSLSKQAGALRDVANMIRHSAILGAETAKRGEELLAHWDPS